MQLDLTLELKKIRSRDDLLEHAEALQSHFNRLADLTIKAQTYQNQHPSAVVQPLSIKELAVSENLRAELNRVLRMEGGREVVEKAQEQALTLLRNNLDAEGSPTASHGADPD